MTKSEIFILNLRSNTDTQGYFYININIPDLRRYNKFSIFIKDFIVLDTDTATNLVSPDIFTLNSDTMMLSNNYDNFNEATLQSSSKVLSIVSIKSPYANNNNESYFPVISVNGNHRFWLEEFNEEINTFNEFYFSIVINATE